MPDSPQQPPPGPPDVETAKWFEEIKRQDAHRAHDNAHEFYTYVNQATIKTGELTLRMALLINGGAAVSLLTFVGNMPVGRKHAVADTLVWFAAGVALAVAGIGFAYFTSYFMGGHVVSQKRIWEHPYLVPGPATPRYRALNIAFHIAAVLACLGSLAVFICGMLSVRNALAIL